MLTDAVLAPTGISAAPIATHAIPIPSKTIPIAYFMLALGLYLLSHHFENRGAIAIINKEFNTPNQDAGTSAISFWNSVYNIHRAIIHIMIKLNPKNIFDNAYFENVFLNNNHNTHVMIPRGIIVINELITLKINAVSPSKTLCV